MEVLCYNRGCGKKYNPGENTNPEACLHHPGAPFFHDAYKGWTCCGKKATDFTEFLNTPGCTKGLHSNVKPQEPESITGKKDDRDLSTQVEEFKGGSAGPAAVVASRLVRPSFSDTGLVTVVPVKAASLSTPVTVRVADSQNESGQLAPGESCKNGGCKATYGDRLADGDCVHHPGVPVFHEGMKFWSCCMKRTSDFQAFLEQVGCTSGSHKWIKERDSATSVQCRYDWHQTATHVVVAIYCKDYHPDKSTVQVHPIRLNVLLDFPSQGGSFSLDLELVGVISVEDTVANFLSTKVEIKMKKAEPGSWSNLYLVRSKETAAKRQLKVEDEDTSQVEEQVDALDLDEVEVVNRSATLSDEASGGRTGLPVI